MSAFMLRGLGGVFSLLSFMAIAVSAQQVPALAQLSQGVFVVGGDTIAVENGSLQVPVLHVKPDGERLTLRFVRFRSGAAKPGAPVVFLAGGPGDAATRAFRGMPIAFLNQLRAIGDVIAFDQRGTGFSEPLSPLCPPGVAQPYGDPINPTTLLTTLRARLRSCLDSATRKGVPVEGLTTFESAADLEDLRRALAVSSINILAGSYGTHLAIAAARQYPSLIHRMVLAGVEGPDDTFKDPALVDQVIREIARTRRPTFEADIRLLRTTLSAEPARVALPNGATLVVGEWELQRWIAETVDEVREIDAVIAAIPALLAKDYTVLARWSLGFRAPRALNLMNLAMDCASNGSTSRLERISRNKSTAILSDAINFPLPDLCEAPGLPRLNDAFRAPLRSDVQALLIVGTLDGRTPVANARAVASGMLNARVLVIEGASHGLFHEQEALGAMVEFLSRM